MSFQGRVSVTVTGLNEIIAANARMRASFPQFKMQVHREGADFFARDAVANAHVITGKTKRSVRVESVTTQAGVISAGFGMPHEQKRLGTKGGTVHTTFTESGKHTAIVWPGMIKRRFDEFLARHRTR